MSAIIPDAPLAPELRTTGRVPSWRAIACAVDRSSTSLPQVGTVAFATPPPET